MDDDGSASGQAAEPAVLVISAADPRVPDVTALLQRHHDYCKAEFPPEVCLLAY